MSYIQFCVSFPMMLVIFVVIEYKISHFFAVIQFILFYKFAIAIDLYRVLWLQMTGISTQR
jgi:hypothetical protein